MTDNEIIKALACCTSSSTILACHKCPARRNRDCGGSDVNVSSVLLVGVLTLLNRLKAEIEGLQKANESFSCMGMFYSEIKSEARKEFVERLKERATKIKWISGGKLVEKEYKISREELDNLLEEMEERECN